MDLSTCRYFGGKFVGYQFTESKDLYPDPLRYSGFGRTGCGKKLLPAVGILHLNGVSGRQKFY